jgi:hypothetical protein
MTSLKHVVFENVIINTCKGCVRRNTKCYVMKENHLRHVQSTFRQWLRNFICNIFVGLLSRLLISRLYQKMNVYNSDQKISYAQVHSYQHETTGGRLHENIYSWNAVIIQSKINCTGINPMMCSNFEIRNFRVQRMIENQHAMMIGLIETCGVRKVLINKDCVRRNMQCYFM